MGLGQDNTDFVASAAESLSVAFDRFEGVLAQASCLRFQGRGQSFRCLEITAFWRRWSFICSADATMLVSWQGVALVLPADKPATPPKKAQLSVIFVSGADLCCALLLFV